MGAIGIAVLAKKNQLGKIYDLNIKNINYETKGFECDKCSNNCEILRIYRDKELLDSWGSKCGRY